MTRRNALKLFASLIQNTAQEVYPQLKKNKQIPTTARKAATKVLNESPRPTKVKLTLTIEIDTDNQVTVHQDNHEQNIANIGPKKLAFESGTSDEEAV